MGNCWQAQKGHKVLDLMNELKAKYHSPELDEANIAVVFDDAEKLKYVNPDMGLVDYGSLKQVSPKAKPTTQNETYPDGLDFIIYINALAWSDLTPNQQRAKMDEWLASAGVKYVPERAELKAKPGQEAKPGPIIKDEKGRTVYTDEIQRDDQGRPIFKTIKPDIIIYMDALRRNGIDAFPEDQLEVLKELLTVLTGASDSDDSSE